MSSMLNYEDMSLPHRKKMIRYTFELNNKLMKDNVLT